MLLNIICIQFYLFETFHICIRLKNFINICSCVYYIFYNNHFTYLKFGVSGLYFSS